MSTKRYKPEQVVNLLRQIEVEIANGKATPQACRDAQITVQTYYRWRKEFGGLKLDQAKRHDAGRLRRADPLDQLAVARVTGLDGPSRHGFFFPIQSKISLAGVVVGTVTLETVFRQNRPDITVEADFRCRGNAPRGDQCDPDNEIQQGIHGQLLPGISDFNFTFAHTGTSVALVCQAQIAMAAMGCTTGAIYLSHAARPERTGNMVMRNRLTDYKYVETELRAKS